MAKLKTLKTADGCFQLQAWPFAEASFKFRSLYAALLVSQAEEEQENIYSLLRFGFDCQVMEAVPYCRIASWPNP